MPYDMSMITSKGSQAPEALLKPKPFLQRGNGHQRANRRKAQEFVRQNLPGLTVLDEGSVRFEGYGTCHFAAYTDPKGAMISTPHRNDNEYGSVAWHSRDHIMMVRDMGDGRRVVVYVCPIPPLFGRRTVGRHGVSWNDVRTLAVYKPTFLIS
ncbi:hypothetical protein FHG66_11315 [Rubellimicrobium rubrum]|uniref:Uncharacterized protein n=1 Tax=Rubellimicrobium rubrum TaxID=2585369 RepID=A0A5C4MVB1_9RHOB|nr:hypothetical protein [Rubellimicrobium rubrum]TNC49315.1 hypothetical protein FHG66_11315 [Rubellimicrobium rubrum]